MGLNFRSRGTKCILLVGSGEGLLLVFETSGGRATGLLFVQVMLESLVKQMKNNYRWIDKDLRQSSVDLYMQVSESCKLNLQKRQFKSYFIFKDQKLLFWVVENGKYTDQQLFKFIDALVASLKALVYTCSTPSIILADLLSKNDQPLYNFTYIIGFQIYLLCPIQEVHNSFAKSAYLFCMIKRYQNYRQEGEQQMIKSKELAKTALFFNNQYPRAFNGDTWDAKHLSSFLSRSNYSNWKGNQANISRMSEASHKRSYSSTQGDHFFKTTKDDRNQSKIGFTPIFPLVSNIPIVPAKQVSLKTFFNSSEIKRNEERAISGRSIKLRCNPEEKFKFQGNAIKFQATDPITMSSQTHPFQAINGFRKERMNRLIQRRHPHGMTGIDHPQNPESQYYSVYEESNRVREEPNSHNSFVFDREWKSKKRSVPPVDEWKNRKAITIRKSRNQNVHGYNIITNRHLVQ